MNDCISSGPLRKRKMRGSSETRTARNSLSHAERVLPSFISFLSLNPSTSWPMKTQMENTAGIPHIQGAPVWHTWHIRERKMRIPVSTYKWFLNFMWVTSIDRTDLSINLYNKAHVWATKKGKMLKGNMERKNRKKGFSYIALSVIINVHGEKATNYSDFRIRKVKNEKRFKQIEKSSWQVWLSAV